MLRREFNLKCLSAGLGLPMIGQLTSDISQANSIQSQTTTKEKPKGLLKIRIGGILVEIRIDDVECRLTMPMQSFYQSGDKVRHPIPGKWAMLFIASKEAHVQKSMLEELLNHALCRQRRLWFEFEYGTNDGPVLFYANAVRPTSFTVKQNEDSPRCTFSVNGMVEASATSAFSSACASA